jgi:hypothetical protein
MPSQTPSNSSALNRLSKAAGRPLASAPADPQRAADQSPGSPPPAGGPQGDQGASHHSHVVVFEHDAKSCSQALFDIMQAVPPEGMTLRALLHALGERGLLIACIIFALPSLLPIPIPGMSVPQGVIIFLIGLGVLFNRSPFLPDRLLEFRIAHRNLFLILEKGVKLFARVEKFSYPRMGLFTNGPMARSINGALLVVGALLLGAPLPIPFSNVLPAYGILFLAFGDMQRDGWLVIAGYVMLVLTVAYMVLVLFFGMSWIHSFFH